MDDQSFAKLKAKVLFQRKFDFDNYSQDYVKRRINVRTMNLGLSLDDWDAYVKYLDENPGEYDKLFDAFSVNVTEFFRDPSLWIFLRDGFLKNFFAERAASGRTLLRIWSAGCSTGEEPYSLAIILKELLPPKISPVIIATDIYPDALARAQEGVYPI